MAFSVTRRATELIIPAISTLCEIKQLSNIDDQEGLRFQLPIVLSYKNHPSVRGNDPVEVIRQALSKTLVFYYPFAGRLMEAGSNKKLMVDCNGKGVPFTEADANMELDHLGDAIYPPCPYLTELLCNVPDSFDQIVGYPLLTFQVTRFTCGGFVVAFWFNHTMCDAYGMLNFLEALAEIARGVDVPTLLPIWRRDLLNARNPPRISCTHHEYEHIEITKDILMVTDPTDITVKSFYFGSKEIGILRENLPIHLRNSSAFELITASLWICRTIALEYDPDDVVRVTCVLSVRNKSCNMNLPSGYYGNAIATIAVCSKVKHLCENPFTYAVELVKIAKSKMSEEYMRSVADLMVLKGRPRCAAMGNFIVSDITRLSGADIDFGWGKPFYGGPATTMSNFSFYASYESKEGEQGILVSIRLPLSAMERFEKELKKMTNDPNENSYNTKMKVASLCKL